MAVLPGVSGKSDSDEPTMVLQGWINRLEQGDPQARDALLGAASSRLRLLAHEMLYGDRLHRWEQTDDVLQDATLELHRSLETARPVTVRQFLALASFHIHRVLTNMARRYYGPHGMGTNSTSALSPAASRPLSSERLRDGDETPSMILGRAEQRQRLHQAVRDLPDEEREVTELMWFHGLTQQQVASIVGVSERTVQRRWMRARIGLFEALKHEADEACWVAATRQGSPTQVGSLP